MTIWQLCFDLGFIATRSEIEKHHTCNFNFTKKFSQSNNPGHNHGKCLASGAFGCKTYRRTVQ